VQAEYEHLSLNELQKLVREKISILIDQ